MGILLLILLELQKYVKKSSFLGLTHFFMRFYIIRASGGVPNPACMGCAAWGVRKSYF